MLPGLASLLQVSKKVSVEPGSSLETREESASRLIPLIGRIQFLGIQ